MLIESGAKGVSLVEYPGKVVLSIKVRSWELNAGEFPWAADPLHGVEGVWYLRDDLDQDFIKVEPFDKLGPGDCWLHYELAPVPQAKSSCTHWHRWIVRYWDDDVYVPTVASMRIQIVEHFHADGPIWEFMGNGVSIYGLPLG